jgi:hypothetical protein
MSGDILALASVNSFASPNIAEYNRAALLDEIAQLREDLERDRQEIKGLKEKITALESIEEQDISRLALDIAQDRRRLAKMEQRPHALPKGAKTLARIAKIDEILKSRGATTLKEVERILKISPKEMNRLLAKLDMRRYELHERPGDSREKVLRLRVQIR